MLGHLLLENLLEDGFDAFADPGLHVPFDGLLELVVLRGQVLTSSLNPQLTRHYRSSAGLRIVMVLPPSRSRIPSWASLERVRERASREIPVASAISCLLKDGRKTTPLFVTLPSSVARSRSIRATLWGAL